MIVRWRFATLKNVVVNGASAKVKSGNGYQSVEFDHLKDSVLEWQ